MRIIMLYGFSVYGWFKNGEMRNRMDINIWSIEVKQHWELKDPRTMGWISVEVPCLIQLH